MPIPSTNHFSLLLAFLITISSLIAPSTSHHHSLNDACNFTLHRSLCIRSLSSFSHPSARQTMRWWARAALSVTISETENMYQCLKKIHNKNNKAVLKGKHVKSALSDCVECFDDANNQLHESLRELRRLQPGGEFGLQMSNVETWVSSALTNQDTCHDGLAEYWRGPLAGRVKSQVLNATYFTSNALALINELASEGGSG